MCAIPRELYSSLNSRFLMNLAGLPPMTVQGSTSFETTEPAATIAPSPTFTPGRTVAFAQTHALSPIVTGLV